MSEFYNSGEFRKGAGQMAKDATWTFWKILIPFFIVATIGMLPLGCALGWFSSAVHVVQRELDPATVQRKYEWFKDASAALDAKQSSITVYAKRFQSLEDDYKGVKRPDWARDDREQWSIWQSEVSGVRASYNQLAAEYNAQMAKWNWRFANAGELPAGATRVLPREYKPYEEN